MKKTTYFLMFFVLHLCFSCKKNQPSLDNQTFIVKNGVVAGNINTSHYLEELQISKSMQNYSVQDRNGNVLKTCSATENSSQWDSLSLASNFEALKKLPIIDCHSCPSLGDIGYEWLEIDKDSTSYRVSFLKGAVVPIYYRKFEPKESISRKLVLKILFEGLSSDICILNQIFKMLLHNITFNVDNKVHEQWLRWMKSDFVPSVMATKLPQKSNILRLLTEIDNGGATYSLQFFFEEMEDYMSFEMNHKERLFNDLSENYQGKYVMFSTLLEEI